MLQMNTFDPMKTLYLSLIGFFMMACGNGQVDENTTTNTNPKTPMQEAVPETPNTPEPLYVYVVMETSMGDVTIALDSTNAPQTVNNFLSYVDDKSYDGTVFHRVISNFMIQGGGFTPDGKQKTTQDPIFLESQNGLKNTIGTLAMARTNAPNSATSQFFINVKDNDFLNYAPGNPGYAVFGKVASGMEVVNEIRAVKTGSFEQYQDWPVDNVMIKTIRRE
jgi:peptidyl-prolyl cis-trans isomerase A (cyclophilin A)